MTSALGLQDDPYTLPMPAGDTLVVLPQWIRPGNSHHNARFRDALWPLAPLIDNPGVDLTAINWEKCPRDLHGQVKLAAWTMINGRLRSTYLQTRGARARARRSSGVLQVTCREWMRLARWLHTHGITDLAECDTVAWRRYIAQRWTDRSSRTEAEMVLGRLTDLWLFDQLSARPARIDRPPWDTEGADDFLPPAGTASAGTENSTEPLDPQVIGPLLVWAIRMVEDFADDILAGWAEHCRLRSLATTNRTTLSGRVELEALVLPLLHEGAQLPAMGRQGTRKLARAYLAGTTGASLAQVDRLNVRHGLTSLAAQRPGPCPMQVPVTGRIKGSPWRERLDYHEAAELMRHLGTAALVICLYLTGMRPQEVRELGRDCAITEIGADGRTRYKIRGRVYKNRKMSGDEADWVVLDIVHEAVEVLKLINDDPTHLFGYRLPSDYVLLSNMPLRLKNFRDHLNALFSTPEESYIPGLAAEDLGLDTETELGNSDESDEEQNEDPLAWAFDTRQFRRTLAGHIANQPFGVVAGTRQYKHASHAIFEGYAGTSASGFADEVAADKAVALLDYVEDLYHDWNEGGLSAGGAVKRVEAEFDRIRAELGDLPGAVASPERLRTMLRHLTRTLHPGALNDCFHHAETAVCGKRAKNVRQPLPMLNMCLSCPNSRRSAVHIPRIRLTRDLAHEEFKDIRGVPVLQEAAIREFETTLDAMIAELHAEEGSPL